MHQMTREEFNNTRRYVEKKALELMKHEKKNDAITGVPLENYMVLEKAGRIFYSVQNNTFKVIADEFLIKAQNDNPEKFGTGEAHDVIEAIRLVNPIFDHERFIEFLSHERFAYIFEAENGEVVDRILRLDLFRLIKTDQKGKNQFIGGLLHALKHFSRNGLNYSTGKGGHSIYHPQHLIEQIVNAFFSVQGVFETENQYVVINPYDEKYNLKFVFYREGNTGVFFLKTVYKEKNDPTVVGSGDNS
jgi:hypothetical protein